MTLPTVLVTRPEPHAGIAVQSLQALGVSAVAMPVLAIEPNAFEIHLPEKFELVVFVSGFAFQMYWRRLQQSHPGYVWPSYTKIAVVGQATYEAICAQISLPEMQIIKPLQGQPSDSEHLWPHIAKLVLKNVLIVRGQTGRAWLAEQLQAKGVSVFFLQSYVRKTQHWELNQVKIIHKLQQTEVPVVWWITSGEGFTATWMNIRRLQLESWWWRSHFWVVHERIQKLVEQTAVEEGADEIDSKQLICQICPPTLEDFQKRLLAYYA